MVPFTFYLQPKDISIIANTMSKQGQIYLLLSLLLSSPLLSSHIIHSKNVY